MPPSDANPLKGAVGHPAGRWDWEDPLPELAGVGCQSPAARSRTESRDMAPSMPCHHRRSQCEQLNMEMGSSPNCMSITTRWRVRQAGHFITLVVGSAERDL